MNQIQAEMLAEKAAEWVENDVELQRVAKEINLPFYVQLAKDTAYLFRWFVGLLYSNGYKIVRRREGDGL